MASAVAKPKPAVKKTGQQMLAFKATAGKKRAKEDSDEENTEGEPSFDDDDSLLSNTPPSAKRQKKAPAPKKTTTTSKPLATIDNESLGLDGASDPKPKAAKGPAKKGTATEQYQKLTQLEHILKRPDTYVGSVERTSQEMWVFNSETASMQHRSVSYVPALYKIFDEILVNAADNKQRDKNMDELRVEINREKGMISVKNTGQGIPIQIHEVSVRPSRQS